MRGDVQGCEFGARSEGDSSIGTASTQQRAESRLYKRVVWFVSPDKALDSHPASNFVVLLAHTKLLSFKGLYACNGEEDGTAYRVFGLGPPHVDASMVSAAPEKIEQNRACLPPTNLFFFGGHFFRIFVRVDGGVENQTATTSRRPFSILCGRYMLTTSACILDETDCSMRPLSPNFLDHIFHVSWGLPRPINRRLQGSSSTTRRRENSARCTARPWARRPTRSAWSPRG